VCSLSNTLAVKDQQTAKWTAITRRLTGTHRHTGALSPQVDVTNTLADVLSDLHGMKEARGPRSPPTGNGVHVPVKKPAWVKELDIDNRARNALLRSARCPGERGFALLAQRRRTLRHVTAGPGETGLIARAARVLVLFEHKMLT